MFTYHSVLTEAQCEDVRTTLWGLRDRWIRRDLSANFYTLGVAAYLDVVYSNDSSKDYYSRLADTNALLMDHFGSLLYRVRDILSDVLNEQVDFAKGLAIPGFHIFLGDAIGRAGEAAPHYDRQYIRLEWPGGYKILRLPLSFTLPVRLPRMGSGLLTWPENALSDWSSDTNPSPNETATVLRPVYTEADHTLYYPYKPGLLLLQRGLTLHRIAAPESVEADDERISLQGHAIKCEGRWLLYW
jgi:hypothetical protein